MNISTIVILAAFAVLLVASSSDAKRLFADNDNDAELSEQKARMFLRSMLDDDDNSSPLDKRESGKNCVPCTFGINPCCAPNICIKKRS
jgi:hypothetical protein